jgi:type VI secretion system protein VasG
MAKVNRAIIYGKLNQPAHQSLRSAVQFCQLRGNPYVELVHWLHQMRQLTDSDLHRIIDHFGLNPSQLERHLTAALERLPRGSTSVSNFAPHIDEAVERGWVYATVFGSRQIRIGHLIFGILRTPSLRNVLIGISTEFDEIDDSELGNRFEEIIAGSPEDGLGAIDGTSNFESAIAPASTEEAASVPGIPKQDALQQFSIDLTKRAREGELDPVVGRDEEIRQIMDILMRRRQNNPILTGEAGVGKTAVVEGFALRIVAGDVPPPLQEVTVRTLDVGLLQAGASFKGEFEKRLRQVIGEVQSSPKPIILFIDEAHTLIGAGGSAGTGDAANLLKPALARGTLRTIAATTWSEYKKYIEKDPALTRRFQAIAINEPSEEKAILMMRGVASTLERHHKVQILDDALEAAVRLSHRYIPARQLPDKAVSLLDTAAARVAISQHAVPPEVEDSRRRIEGLDTELRILAGERAVGGDTKERERQAGEALTIERERLADLEARWKRENALVDQILELRARLRSRLEPIESISSQMQQAVKAEITAGMSAADGNGAPTDEERHQSLIRLRQLQAELADLQGEMPLVLVSVDRQAVAKVVEDWTGTPVGRMVRNEIEAVLHLKDMLARRIVGQDHALEAIAKRIQTARAGLDNPAKPIGVFMLCGPSGVGKTETALALAEALYGGEQNVITINMSEFQEAHTVSTLKGSPPGYVGFGEGGRLTEAVRRKPYSIVLLDEVEKAHPDVHEIFFQVFDKGQMEDAEGRRINFRNTLILLTTNVGTELIMNMCQDPDLMPEADGLAKALRAPLLKVFPPALLGRLMVIPYYPLSPEVIDRIIRLQLSRIGQRIAGQHKAPFSYDEEVVRLITSRCTEAESGGRMIDAILTNTLLPALSAEFLTRMIEHRPVDRVHIGVADGEFAYEFV